MMASAVTYFHSMTVSTGVMTAPTRISDSILAAASGVFLMATMARSKALSSWAGVAAIADAITDDGYWYARTVGRCC